MIKAGKAINGTFGKENAGEKRSCRAKMEVKWNTKALLVWLVE
jgi:hypothetical protein